MGELGEAIVFVTIGVGFMLMPGAITYLMLRKEPK